MRAALRSNFRRFVIFLIGTLVGVQASASETGTPRFTEDVQPLFAAHCVKCHGPEKQKGGLRLDDRSSALKGGDSGKPGIAPGHASQSRVFQLVSTGDADARMPSKAEPLSARQIEVIRRWIDSGAEWPETGIHLAKKTRSEMTVTESDRQHWAFRPLRGVEPPKVAGSTWARTPVDQFILRGLESKGIRPAQPASPRTLVRRIYFDLIGLPPTPEEMRLWTARLASTPGPGTRSGSTIDKGAMADLVESLLANPHHGERWARHWLDVARYADSNGMEGDHDRPNAYHYRDFVIRAFNEDMPFNQFVRWQLAGDELAPDTLGAIAATGFLAAGPNEPLPVPMEEEKLRGRANELDDIVSTTGQAFLGLTLACARCHDHKYDPLPTKEYYRIMRVFNSGDRAEVPLASQGEAKAHRALVSKWKADHEAAVQERDEWMKKASAPLTDQARAAKIAALKISEAEKRLLRETPEDEKAKELGNRFKKELKIENADYAALLPPEAKPRWEALEAKVKAVVIRKPPALPAAFAFSDFASEPRVSWFFERGNFMARNEKMELGFLSVLTKDKTAEDFWRSARDSKLREDSTQQRRALAAWMTDVEHGAGALLARVIVNRVWKHHFGEGLVRTVSDFGTRGELPTHPELLEWLTSELIRHDWSLKRLHALLVNSSTYQQGAAFEKDKELVDPDNRLLSRRSPRRLESEMLRDSMLAVAGTLSPGMFGPAFKPPIPAEAMQARNVKNPYPRDAKDSPETRRRTVYMFHKRVVQYPLMQAFDAPDAQVSCGKRMNTTVAPQAMALLNDPFVRLRAEELARRVAAESGAQPEPRARRLFQLCLGREPEPMELSAATDFLLEQTGSRQSRAAAQPVEKARHLALTDLCQSMFALNEFIYVD